MAKQRRHRRTDPTRGAEPTTAAQPAWLRFGWSAKHGLLLTVVATAIVRLVHWRSVRTFDPWYAQTSVGLDMHTYLAWARTIAQGDWLSIGFTSGQPFYYGPLYPYFLAVLLRVFGENYDVIHAAQAVIALLPPIAIWSACRQLFGPGPALASGLLTALCAPILYYEQVLLMEGLLTAIHAGILWAAVRGQCGVARAWWWALCAGVLSGLACWGRSSFLPVIPMMAAAWVIVWRMHTPAGGATSVPAGGGTSEQKHPSHRGASWKNGLLLGGVYLLGCAVPLSLTLWRNVHVAGQYVLTTSNGPVTLYIGNASDATGVLEYSPSFCRREKDRDHLQKEWKDLNTELGAAIAGGDMVRADSLTRRIAEVDQSLQHFWTAALLEEIRSKPDRWIGLLLRKTWTFWNSYDVPDNVSYYLDKRHSWIVRWSPVSWLALVPLGALGIVWSWSHWRTQIFLYAYSVGFSLSIILVFVTGRYRLQTLLPMLVWAGFAVSHWLWETRERRWVGVGLAVVWLAAGIVVLWPTWSPAARQNAEFSSGGVQLVRASDYLNLAKAHFRIGQTQQACRVLEDDLRAYPGDPFAALGVAAVYNETGVRDKAIATLEAVMKAGRANAEVFVMVAEFYARDGRPERATAMLQHVLRYEPDNAAALDLLQRLPQVPR